MKYIVFWTFLKITPVPCPQQAEFEKMYGKGYSCLVAHGKIQNIPDSAWYWSRASAYQKYADLITEREKACVMVNEADKLPFPEYFLPPYSNIRVDSSYTNSKLK